MPVNTVEHAVHEPVGVLAAELPGRGDTLVDGHLGGNVALMQQAVGADAQHRQVDPRNAIDVPVFQMADDLTVDFRQVVDAAGDQQ